MKNKIALVCVILLSILTGVVRGVTYHYDEQHRLIGASYNTEAVISYKYDKANNLVEFNVMTDSQYLKPFMLFFSQLERAEPMPLCYRLDGWRQKNTSLWKI